MNASQPKIRWLSRNVFAIGMLSLFSDMGHELTTAILPLVLSGFGGGAQALGAIEGISDAASSLVKLWMAHYSDRMGRRKPILLAGYLLTAQMGTLAFVTAWWQILIIRAIAWIGRGARGPVRNALLSQSVPPEASGRAFGFEGAMDTLGAVIGPAIALPLVGHLPVRNIFLIAFIPGAVTVLIVIFIIREVPYEPDRTLRIITSLGALPRSFWQYVVCVGIFGLGNFAHSLLILQAVSLLTPSFGTDAAGRLAIGLYIFHNIVYAAASYPAGWAGDRLDKRKLLAFGYALFALMCFGFLKVGGNLFLMSVLFALAGLYIAIVDAMERALAADLLPEKLRGTGFGALATVNSVGDLLSSLVVGYLWTNVSASSGFLYSASLCLLGSLALFFVSRSRKPVLPS